MQCVAVYICICVGLYVISNNNDTTTLIAILIEAGIIAINATIGITAVVGIVRTAILVTTRLTFIMFINM